MTVSAEASDDSGISQVEFFVDGVSFGVVTAPPYSASWDGRTAASGEHTLTAVATDLHGNVATSSPVTVTVDHAPPTLSITSPTDGATLSGVIPLRVNASDDARISRVDYEVDGRRIRSLLTPPYSLDWDSGAREDGPHTLTATVFDMLGKSSTDTVTVNTQQPVSAEYNSTLQVPLCATLAPFCDTTNRVRGKASLEPHTPNTLHPRCDDGVLVHSYREVSRIKVSTVSGAPLRTGERVRIDAHVSLDDANTLVDLFTASHAHEPVWTWLATLRPDSSSYRDQVFSAEYVLPTGRLQAVRVQARVGHDSLAPCSNSAYADRDDVVFAVESPPEVMLASPSNNTRLKGMVTVSTKIDSFHPVAKVEFYDGTTLLSTRTSEPYSFVWATASAADGAHTLSAKVYDTAGRDGTSPPISVTTDNHPPDVALLSPAQSAIVRGEVPIEATVTDTMTTFISRVELYDGTTLLGTSNGPSPSTHRWSWNTGAVADGLHTLTVRAYDQMGHVGTSPAVEVRVDNTAPAVVLTAPASQNPLPVRELIQLSATASDNLGIARVEFYKSGGLLLGTDTSEPYGMSWDTASVEDGNHWLSATAYDHAGNITSSSSTMVSVDNSPPSAALSSPAQGAFLRGTVTLQAAASDNVGLTQLEFYDGATLLGTLIGGRTSLAWNTVGVAEGPHTLTVKAQDKAGNVHTSAGVEVYIDNVAPTTALGAPAQNARLRGSVLVSATASDNQAVERVEFYAGTTLLGTVTTGPYAVSWDTTSGADGSVTLTARAYDAAGNVTVSAGRAVSVDNTAPSVAITSPANGASLFLSTTVQASASDNVGVTHVVFYDGGTVIGTDTTAPYSVSWNLLNVSKGTHVLTARAHDTTGNVTTSAPITVKVN